MTLTNKRKNEIEEKENYRHAVISSISQEKQLLPQKHGIPLILSVFIPGLGQIVKGQVKKGLIILFSPIIALAFIFLLSFFSNNSSQVLVLLGNLWLIWVILYVWQLIDSYNN
jgi:hypothetical protein